MATDNTRDTSRVGECGNWQARHDFRTQPPKLTVEGECTFGTPGFVVKLSEADPQGINKRILLLNKTVTPPTGIVPQLVTTIPVSFEKTTEPQQQQQQEAGTHPYDQVQINPEGVLVEVKILS